jgi:transposase
MRPADKHVEVVRGVKAMALKRRTCTRELKLQVVREVEAGKPVAQAAREYEIHPTQITKWRQLQRRYTERAFAGNGQTYKEEARRAELERMVGQLTMENAWLKKVLLRLEGSSEGRSGTGGR